MAGNMFPLSGSYRLDGEGASCKYSGFWAQQSEHQGSNWQKNSLKLKSTGVELALVMAALRSSDDVRIGGVILLVSQDCFPLCWPRSLAGSLLMITGWLPAAPARHPSLSAAATETGTLSSTVPTTFLKPSLIGSY